MTTLNELRSQADEIAAAGHAGWGNTMRDAADEIDRLKAEAVAADIRIENDALMVAGLTAERDALKAAVEEQRRIIETLNAGIGCETTLKSIRVLDERDELRAALKDRDDKFAALESQKPVALLAQGFVHGAVGVEKLYFPQERQEAIAFCAAAHERGGYPVTEIRPLYAAAGAAPVPTGWQLVPVEPTDDMWSHLARDIVFWLYATPAPHYGSKLHDFLRNCGTKIPEWLTKEIPDADHTPPKGTVAVVIYKAMLAAAQKEQS